MNGPTVDEPDGCHGDREEGIWVHFYVDQGSSQGKEKEDGYQAEGDTDMHPDPAQRNIIIIRQRQWLL